MTKILSVDLIRFGELIVDLPPMVATASPMSAAPPPGAGRLVGREGSNFKWEPISQDDWRALEPKKRAEIVIERAEEWLKENGDITASPVALVDPSAIDHSAENIFGGLTSTLKEALCKTYRLLHADQATSEIAILGLSMTILVVTGLLPSGVEVTGVAAKFIHELPAATPHIAQAFVVNFGQRFCSGT